MGNSNDKKTGRGGFREGAGRTPVDEPTKAKTVHLTERQSEILKKAGGNPYLRKHLDDLGKLICKEL
jgi:hypothetical protein